MLTGEQRDWPKIGPNLLLFLLSPAKTANLLLLINGTRDAANDDDDDDDLILNHPAGRSSSPPSSSDQLSPANHHDRKPPGHHETTMNKSINNREMILITRKTLDKSGSSRGQRRDLCDKLFIKATTTTINNNNNSQEKQQPTRMAALGSNDESHHHANKDDHSSKMTGQDKRVTKWLLGGDSSSSSSRSSGSSHVGHSLAWRLSVFLLLIITLVAQPKTTSCFNPQPQYDHQRQLPSQLEAPANGETQNSLAAGDALFEARTSAHEQQSEPFEFELKPQVKPQAGSLLSHLEPKFNQSDSVLDNSNENNQSSSIAINNNDTFAGPEKDDKTLVQLQKHTTGNSNIHSFGQRIGHNLDQQEQHQQVAAVTTSASSNLNGPASSDGLSGTQAPLPAAANAGEAEFGERATFSRLAELFPVSKRELIITKLIKQYRKVRSQPSTTEQPSGPLKMVASSGNLDLAEQQVTTGGGGSRTAEAPFETSTIEPTTESLPNYEEATSPATSAITTTASSTGNDTQTDYHLVKLYKPNESTNKTSRSPPSNHRMDHTMDGGETGEEPRVSKQYQHHHNNPWLLLPAPTRHNRSPLRGNQPEQRQHWQASNIEKVIHVGEKKAASMESAGKQVGGHMEELNDGRNEKAAMGERLRDRENSAHWSRDKHGEQRQLGAGKKQAKEGDKWVKDVGHKKHGWKNVYHKEEYANHQKYHDIMLDKDWDNKRAKHSESYHHDKGDRFNDSRSDNRYDKDKHGSKYDYVKGSNWKYQDEDGHHHETDANKLANAESESEAVGRKQSKQRASGGGDFEGGSGNLYDGGHAMAASRRPPPKDDDHHHHHFESRPSSISSMGSQEDQVHPNSNEEIDDVAIERMRDKLNKLSDTTRYSLDGASEGVQDEQAPLASSNSSSFGFRGTSPPISTAIGTTESPDYVEPDDEHSSQQHQPNNWASHQSINDILKTAKNRDTGHTVALTDPRPTESNARPGPTYSVASGGGDAEAETEAEDDESEVDPADRPTRSDNSSSRITNNGNNKNGLRLKFELDLSKAIPTSLLPTATKVRARNHTRISPQYEIVTQQPSLIERTARKASNHSGSYHRYNNLTSGYPTPTRLANGHPYASYPLRSVKVERANTLQVFGNQAPPSSTTDHRFNAEEGQRNVIESVIPTRRPPASTSVNSPPSRHWTGSGNHQVPGSNLWPSTSQQFQHQMQMPPPPHKTIYHQQPTRQASNNNNDRPYQPVRPIVRNFTDHGTLSALSHVLPNRPIFVKHLQMNGGIMLGTKPYHHHLNRSSPFASSRRQPSLIIPATSVGGEDMTIETSLNNAFGDIVTLPGGQQVQINHHQEAESSMVEPEHASREQQYHMVESSPASFGGDPFPVAETGGRGGGGRNRETLPHTIQADGEGAVFEVAPGALDDDDPRPSFLGDATHHHHQTNDIESLLAGDDQQLLEQPFGFGQSASTPSFVIDSAGNPTTNTGEKGGTLDGSQFFKPALTVLLNNHHNGPMGGGLGGAQAAASIVIPAVQQTFARFLRFPRVFSQAYRQQPQLSHYNNYHHQLHPQHHQMQASHQQYITAPPPLSHDQQQHFRFQLHHPKQFATDRQLQQRRHHRHIENSIHKPQHPLINRHHFHHNINDHPHSHHLHRRPPLAMQIGESQSGLGAVGGSGSSDRPTESGPTKWIHGPQSSSFQPQTHRGVDYKARDFDMISDNSPHLFPPAPERGHYIKHPTGPAPALSHAQSGRSPMLHKHLLNPLPPPPPQVVIEMSDLMGAASSRVVSSRAVQHHPASTAYNVSSTLAPLSGPLRSRNASENYVTSGLGQRYVNVGANYTIDQPTSRGDELNRMQLKRTRQSRMQKGLIIVAETTEKPEAAYTAAATGRGNKNITLSASLASSSGFSSFVAPQMQSSNWIPSKGIDYSLQRPTHNTTQPIPIQATRNGRPPLTSSLENRQPKQNLQQNKNQQQLLSWFNLPYATMPSRQPIKLDTLADQRSTRSLKMVRGQPDGQVNRSKAILSTATSQMTLASVPTSAPEAAAAVVVQPSSTTPPPQTTANPMSQQFLLITNSSTRVPFFGQRILASFKSKLNNVAG